MATTLRDGPQEFWATGTLVAVTGGPREQRALVQELVENGGGRYSPSLSRRCTHLAVFTGHADASGSPRAAAADTGCSDKLRIAARNRDKWRLRIVDLRWVLESAHAGARLDEAAFPVSLPCTPGPAGGSASKEQMAPNAAAPAVRPAPSRDSGASSLRAADTYHGAADLRRQRDQAGMFSKATLAAAEARAQRSADVLRQSVNSRPLSSFQQPAASLHTQSPSVKRSVRWQCSEQRDAQPAGSTARRGAPFSGGVPAAAAAHAAAVGVLPSEVEHIAEQEEDDGAIDFSRLPMTQAGFIPAADLLEQLRASAAGPLLPPLTEHPSQRQQPSQQQRQQQQQQPQNRHVAGHRQAAFSAAPSRQGSPPLAACEQSPPAAAREQSPAGASPAPSACLAASPMQVDVQQAGQWPGAFAAPPAPGRPAPHGQAALSTADLLEQLRLTAQGAPDASGAGVQAPRECTPGLPTDVLLEQLRASNAGSGCKAPLGMAQQASPCEQHKWRPELSTADLLAQLQQGASGPKADQQQRRQGPAPLRADLLAQLGLAGSESHAGHGQPGRQVSPLSAELLTLLQQASACRPDVEAQLRQHPAPLPADLLNQLQLLAGSAVGEHFVRQQQQQQPGSAGHAQPPAAPEEAQGDLASLLGRLQQLAPAAPTPVAAPPPAGGLSVPPGSPSAGKHGGAASPPTDRDADAAGAGTSGGAGSLAAQLQAVLALQQASSTQLHGAAAKPSQEGGGGRVSELARLLQQYQQSPSAGTCTAPASGVLPAVPAGGGLAAAAAEPPAGLQLAGSGRGGTENLLLQLRSLASSSAVPPAKQQWPGTATQQQRQVLPAVRLPPAQAQQPAGSTSDDAELPPAKYRRHSLAPSPGPGHAAAADSARGAPAGPGMQSPAPAEGVGEGSGILGSPAVTPASSAGSPPAGAAAAARACAAEVAPSDVPGDGQRSLQLTAAGSQVADSGGKVFAAMLALIDPELDQEERDRVCAALERGGGRVADSGGLGAGVSHVVCRPEAALKWLSMGVGIVSPQWVVQSLRLGRQQRCLTVSADASRHLPAPGTTTGSQQPSVAQQAQQAGQAQQAALSSELLGSREARQALLCQLAIGLPGASSAGSPGTATGPASSAAAAPIVQPVTTPAQLLGDVLWSVLDPPAVADKAAPRKPRHAEADEEEVIIVPDSEEEEDEEFAGLCCPTASQAAVEVVLRESVAAGSRSGRAGPGQGQAAVAAWQAETVLAGPAQLTLLFPRDARGGLGMDTRCFPLPLPVSVAEQGPASKQQQQQVVGAGLRHLSAGSLLRLVHGYYAEPLSSEEQLQLLRSFPAAEGVAAVLRPAFLELAAVRRGALLGPRSSFEGLRKATREPAGAVYEVQLGQ